MSEVVICTECAFRFRVPRDDYDREVGPTKTTHYVLQDGVVVEIEISIPDELIAFAVREAKRRGLSRSGFMAKLLEREKVRILAPRYVNRHGWDMAEDEESWRRYQRRRMAKEYADDEW